MQVISAGEAAALIPDGATVGVGGFGAYGAPESLLQAIADRFADCGHPASLTVTCGVSPGDNTGRLVGLNRIAQEGLLDTIIAGHFANPPRIAEMVARNQAAGYALPLGVMIHLYDAIAAHLPEVLTPVGLGTYADPRMDGCRVNARAFAQRREMVRVVEVAGREYLAYRTFPIQACVIRATYADERGNLSMRNEGLGDSAFDLAAATHNSGGIVIAEVQRIVEYGALHPRDVRVHGHMVDYVTVADPGMYYQGYAADDRPELSGNIRVPAAEISPMELTNRKVIARRGAMELRPNCLINLGIGMPSGIGSVANEEGISATLSLESGPQGGVPVEGLGFGASVNPEAIYNLADVFRLYDGGILSMTFLGAAEIDQFGNVNVSKFGARCTGPGGFINISQSTPKVRFVGTFTADGLEEEIADGALHIRKEGRQKKFLKHVRQITFSGQYAREHRREVLYITERAVFRLTEAGLLLTEIAPGVELQRDILDQMEFVPLVSEDLRLMDGRIFRKEKMNIAGKFT